MARDHGAEVRQVKKTINNNGEARIDELLAESGQINDPSGLMVLTEDELRSLVRTVVGETAYHVTAYWCAESESTA